MKKTGLIILSAMLLAGSVHAGAEHRIWEDQETGSIVVSGTMQRDASVREVSVNILKKGKTLDDLETAAKSGVPGALLEVLEYSRQLPANADGSFEVKAKINGESGIYAVCVDYEGNSQAEPEEVSFIRREDRISAAEQLIKAANAKETASILQNQQFVLNFDRTLYETLNADQVAEKLFALLQETPISTDQMGEEALSKLEQAFQRACAIEGILEGKCVISEQLSLLEIDPNSVAARYLSAGNAKMTAEIAERMKKETAKNLAELQAALIRNVVLSCVQYPNGSGEVKEVIRAYAGEIGISNPSEDSAVYARLAGQKLESYQALRSAYQSALSASDSKTQGGGGSGGSSRKENTTGTIAIPGVPSNPTPTEEKTETFTDLDAVPWAKDAILRLYEKKVLAGKSEQCFAPNDSLLREEFTAMLVRAFAIQKTGETVEFSDVSETAWYYDAVQLAAQSGIVKGNGTSFGIGQELTRQDMAVMLYRTAEVVGIEFDQTDAALDFEDAEEISDYAKTAVRILKNAGLINGMGNSCFEPKGINTRAQAAVVIDALLRRGTV